ncbi:GLPGLI family protein [Empedobacter falsenii]|uniref:GLPGLI family protein n=1 Tax=Empedobacter falsenii TaxID=343874 RepID=UPI001C8D3CF5|nr:GLPGLI family protein [Empedobacter falsenii]MBY0067421.1 GLPGLI family protein [Empedobacter falsenii]
MNLYIFIGTISLLAQDILVVDYKFNYDFDTSKVTDKKKLDFYIANNNHSSFYQLITSKNDSYFGKVEKIDNDQHTGLGAIILTGPAGNFYNNLIDKYSLFSIDLNGKKLIVKDSIKALDWTLTKEKDKILGYEVKKAIYHKEKTTIEAWYAPKLDFRNGPAKFYGLPGIILKVVQILDTKEGIQKEIYTAIDVKIDNNAKIEIPTKGILSNY